MRQWVWMVVLAVGCGVPENWPDANRPDGGPDAATRDASTDAARRDAATALDALVPPDAVVSQDATVSSDATISPDAAVSLDAFVAIDAFVAPDAFVVPDAYVSPDAASAPAVPSGVMVVPTPSGAGGYVAGSLTVSWMTAAGATGYTIVATPTAGGSPVMRTVGAITSTTVTSLTNCADYSVVVTATNPVGSTSAAPAIGRPLAAPGAPTVGATSAGGDSVTLSWTAPASNGCTVDLYSVEAVRGAMVITTTPAGTSTTLAGLSRCAYPSVDCTTPTTWSFRVRAHSAGGYSGYSVFPASVQPLVSLGGDQVLQVFTDYGCAGCHSSGSTPPVLTGSGASVRTSILASGAVTTPASSSYLVTCPTGGTCTPSPSHPGGTAFSTSSVAYHALLQWIADGTQP